MIMAASAWAIRGSQMHCINDFKGHPDTESLAKMLKERYDGHKIYAYPDPTGRARKSSAPIGQTDFSILQSFGIECLARTKSPPIVDSVAAVNKKLMTAAGAVDMYLHPRCINTINSLERTKWVDKNMDTATIDKDENIEHHSDGVRYITEYLFPIQNCITRTKRGFTF